MPNMQWLVDSWYQPRWYRYLLWPLSGLYGAVVWVRQWLYKKGIFRSFSVDVPVIVVGNITVGGTGKTPLVAAIVNDLKTMGKKPGIISRGYKGKATQWPQLVNDASDPVLVGDEPVLLAQLTGVPVVASPKRIEAARYLVDKLQCDVIISDDGLQHLALKRHVEIAVIDGERRLGNWMLLPAGPLREPMSRLASVDMIVCNGAAFNDEFAMHLVSQGVKPIKGGEDRLSPQRIHAVAAIGHPERFFHALRQRGFDVVEHAFPDHTLFKPDDFKFQETLPIVMTAKDATKCHAFALENAWVAHVGAELEESFFQRLHALLLTS